jgi:hypothetical protein
MGGRSLDVSWHPNGPPSTPILAVPVTIPPPYTPVFLNQSSPFSKATETLGPVSLASCGQTRNSSPQGGVEDSMLLW